MLGVIREIKNSLSYEANDKKNMAIENQTLISILNFCDYCVYLGVGRNATKNYS